MLCYISFLRRPHLLSSCGIGLRKRLGDGSTISSSGCLGESLSKGLASRATTPACTQINTN